MCAYIYISRSIVLSELDGTETGDDGDERLVARVASKKIIYIYAYC